MLKCGIVGLPNVGKSTLFNTITRSAIAAENYPFCTIKPNTAIVEVPDKRLQQLANIVNPLKIIPTAIEFVDIAGLVKGASEGEGLGNQFLANIREVNTILHVVRAFNDTNITHVHGKIDPIYDIDIINNELILADLATIGRSLVKEQKKAKTGDKQSQALINVLLKLETHLNEANLAIDLELNKNELEIIKPLCLLTIKPMLYVINISDNKADNVLLDVLVEHIQKQKYATIITICIKMEHELISLSNDDKKEFLKTMGLEEPCINRLINTSYNLLNLHTYFTAGVKEIRAYAIEKGTIAMDAAGIIHSDFARGFICAEVISFEDFIACNGNNGAINNGKMRLEGKNYIVRDGDVMHFRFNV